MKLEEIQNRWIALKGIKKIPTVRVLDKTDPSGKRVRTIEVSKFNPLIHERLEDQRAAQPVAAPAPEPTRVSGFSAEEMATMTMEAIEQLPEWLRASERQKSRVSSKQDAIDLVLAVRGSK